MRRDGPVALPSAAPAHAAARPRLKPRAIRPQGVVRPFLKSAIAVLEASGEALDAEEIVRRAIADGLLGGGSADADSAMMRSVLANNMRQKGASSRISVRDGKFRVRASKGATASPATETAAAPAKGAGARRAARAATAPAKGAGAKRAGKPTKPPSPQQLRGAGGEHLVVAQLNSDGYSTVMPEPDEGVDVVASKNGRDYPLQVKTSKGRGGLYTFRFKKTSHERLLTPNAHYVFVLGRGKKSVIVTVPYAEIQKQINLGNIPLKNGIYEAKLRLNTVAMGGQRADMSMYEGRWPGDE